MPAPSSGGVLIGVGAHLNQMRDEVQFKSSSYFERLAHVQRMLLGLRTDDFDDVSRPRITWSTF